MMVCTYFHTFLYLSISYTIWFPYLLQQFLYIILPLFLRLMQKRWEKLQNSIHLHVRIELVIIYENQPTHSKIITRSFKTTSSQLDLKYIKSIFWIYLLSSQIDTCNEELRFRSVCWRKREKRLINIHI